jgi:hypothetical protein
MPGTAAAANEEELAVAALHLVIVLAAHAGGAPSLQDEAAVLHLDADLVAGEPGQFGGEDEGVGGLAEVHGRRPSLRPARGQALEAVLDADELAEGVPARKRHNLASAC